MFLHVFLCFVFSSFFVVNVLGPTGGSEGGRGEEGAETFEFLNI